MVTPFLKWAGGKRWLVSEHLFPIPSRYGRYVEPFLGGGAVFFHLAPKRAILGDLNEDLILTYKVLRDDPGALWGRLKQHQKKHCYDHYYQVRGRVPRTDLSRAARLIYLNRTCWNGLYRVNLRGEFNVPIGTKQTVVFETDDFFALSRLLQGKTLRCCDFEEVIDMATADDFIFVDPPYTANHNMNGFLKYNEKIFSWDDQIRLFDAVNRAAHKGAKIVVTNADHKSIRELYRSSWSYVRLRRHTVIGADVAARRRTSEAMFVANL